MDPDVPDELPSVENFLPTLPRDLRFAIELRHGGWMFSKSCRSFLICLHATMSRARSATADGYRARRCWNWWSRRRQTFSWAVDGAGPGDYRLFARAVSIVPRDLAIANGEATL